MEIQEWNLSETNLARAKNRRYEVAVIPTSAIEPHNLHLPQGQDWLHTNHVAKEACRLAWEKCESVLYLPGIPYGVDSNLMDFPLAIHVSQKTLDKMLLDIMTSLKKHGIQKFVILNGHGGNDFGPFIRQTQYDLGVHVFLCNWWTVGKDKYDEIFDKPDDHAGILETSVALKLFPHLVELDKAGSGKAKAFRFEALNKGWARTSRNFAKLNDHCSVGDPTGADSEKGEKYLDLAIQRISSFLVELAQTPIDKDFPQQTD